MKASELKGGEIIRRPDFPQNISHECRCMAVKLWSGLQVHANGDTDGDEPRRHDMVMVALDGEHEGRAFAIFADENVEVVDEGSMVIGVDPGDPAGDALFSFWAGPNLGDILYSDETSPVHVWAFAGTPPEEPKPTLSPATLNLPPLSRLVALRDWLRDGELPEGTEWDYSDWVTDPSGRNVFFGGASNLAHTCGTAACAGGWYHLLTGFNPRIAGGPVFAFAEHFGISFAQATLVFTDARDFLQDNGFREFDDDAGMEAVTREDVADVIDMVLNGEINEEGELA